MLDVNMLLGMERKPLFGIVLLNLGHVRFKRGPSLQLIPRHLALKVSINVEMVVMVLVVVLGSFHFHQRVRFSCLLLLLE